MNLDIFKSVKLQKIFLNRYKKQHKLKHRIIIITKTEKHMLSKFRVAFALLAVVLLTASTGAATNLKAMDVLSKCGTTMLLASLAMMADESSAIKFKAL